MYRVMIRTKPKGRRWCERKRTRGKPMLLQEFCDLEDARRFSESTPNSFIVFGPKVIRAINAERAA